jgi:lactate permease
MPSLGHSWAVTFGSLGSSFNALLAATGLGWEQLAAPAALLLGAACFGAGAGVAYLAGGWTTVKKLLLPVLGVGALMAAVQYAAAVSGLWNIAGLLGGTAGLASGIALILGWKRGRKGRGKGSFLSRRLLTALSGYLVLVALTLAVQLIPPLGEFLGRVVLTLEFPKVSTGLGYTVPAGTGRMITPLRHAGTILTVASGLAFGIFYRAGWYQEGAGKRVLGSLVKGMIPSSVGITAMVMMAVIMRDTGMIEQLAEGLSRAVGSLFPLLSPWVGALGAFMTGSNTNSNLVFALLQLRTAEVMGVPVAVILAAQTSGAALGSVIAPTKVIVGASTAGLAGEEGRVMRALLPYIFLLLLLLSGLTAVGVSG